MPEFLSGQVLKASDLNALALEDGWHAPTPGTLWSNFGAGYNDLGYRKLGDDSVVVRGVVLSSADTDTLAKRRIFTLPVGYRPASTWTYVHFAEGADAAEGPIRIDVQPDGQVVLIRASYGMDLEGTWAYVALDGIQFTLD